MTQVPSIAVGYDAPELQMKAEALAKSLQLPVDNTAALCLQVTSTKLVLKKQGFSPLHADFSFSHWKRRHNEGKKQGLIRACKPKSDLYIIDATAGWGRDAALLASFGAKVLMLEQDPVVSALLADALIQQDKESQTKLQLSLLSVNSFEYLKNLKPCDYPDIIYIDPMHPERTKSALVKKEMQILQTLVGAQQGALELIQLAVTRVKDKVVVKWPEHAPPLLQTPNAIHGRTVRFDMYSARTDISS
jgi:16S rRNA (guanine1516-N2)-methyltransferase